jgi:hypothetical protein
MPATFFVLGNESFDYIWLKFGSLGLSYHRAVKVTTGDFWAGKVSFKFKAAKGAGRGWQKYLWVSPTERPTKKVKQIVR